MEEESNNSAQESQSVSNQTQPVRTSETPSRRKKRGKPAVSVIIIIIILAILGGGAWFLLKEPDVETQETSPSGLSVARPVDNPTSTPLPTETSAPVNKDEVSIQILNGSGISGEAGLLQGKLGDLDYTDIEIGNSGNQDQEVTTVVFSTKLSKTVVDEITAKLNELYKSVNVKESSTGKFDVDIVIGLRKNQDKPTAAPTKAKVTDEPSPTQTDTPTPTI